jgi:predicted methyltransferase
MTTIGHTGRTRGATAGVLMLLCGLAAAAGAAAPSVYERALATAGRSAEDKARDARDQPAALYAFAGFRRGMRIADIFGGGGYHSELLSYIVGPAGHVLLVNNPPYASYGAAEQAARFRDGRLPQIERRVVQNTDLELGRATLDAALIVMSYHDLYWEDKDSFPRIDAAQFLEQIRAAVKPGGRLLVVDHAAATGSGSAPAQTLHRIDEQFAIRDLESHGFKLEKTWDGLRNPADDRARPVFDPAIRGRTDRFVHLYRRL